MALSWGWTRAELEQHGYPGSLGDLWIEDLARVLQKCIAIGLLVILPPRYQRAVLWLTQTAYHTFRKR